MTSEEYRKKLSNYIINYRLVLTLEQLKFTDELDFLLTVLKDGDFYRNASIQDLYKFRRDLFNITTFFSNFIKTVDEEGLVFLDELEDQTMSFDELGIKSKTFECAIPFTDMFSKLHILPKTIIEVKNLKYANTEDMVIATYTNLVTDSTIKEIIDIFIDGKQETILNLKILGENFKPT